VTFNELGEAELTEDIDKNQVRGRPIEIGLERAPFVVFGFFPHLNI